MSGIRETIIELAARHDLDTNELLEAWGERAAIREYLAGYTRHTAELTAIGDVEEMFSIGLRCSETRRMMAEGGDRQRPTGARPMVHAVARDGLVWFRGVNPSDAITKAMC